MERLMTAAQERVPPTRWRKLKLKNNPDLPGEREETVLRIHCKCSKVAQSIAESMKKSYSLWTGACARYLSSNMQVIGRATLQSQW